MLRGRANAGARTNRGPGRRRRADGRDFTCGAEEHRGVNVKRKLTGSEGRSEGRGSNRCQAGRLCLSGRTCSEACAQNKKTEVGKAERRERAVTNAGRAKPGRKPTPKTSNVRSVRAQKHQVGGGWGEDMVRGRWRETPGERHQSWDIGEEGGAEEWKKRWPPQRSRAKAKRRRETTRRDAAGQDWMTTRATSMSRPATRRRVASSDAKERSQHRRAGRPAQQQPKKSVQKVRARKNQHSEGGAADEADGRRRLQPRQRA